METSTVVALVLIFFVIFIIVPMFGDEDSVNMDSDKPTQQEQNPDEDAAKDDR